MSNFSGYMYKGVLHLSSLSSVRKILPLSFSRCPQNQERKHRTYVYVLIVTEVLEDWEDSVNIGKSSQIAPKERPTLAFATPQVTTQNQKQEPDMARNNRRICLIKWACSFLNLWKSVFWNVEKEAEVSTRWANRNMAHKNKKCF